MRYFSRTKLMLAAGLALLLGAPARPQTPEEGGGQGRQRGGFGGGQMVQGTVTGATPDSVTVKTDAGDTYTVKPNENARILKDRQPIKLSDVKIGDGVTAMGAVDASAKTVAAMMVMDVDAAAMAKAKEDMGKTYITGRITAIDADNLKLTVMRTDGVSQGIAVDDGTSFQRGARGIEVPSMMGGFGGGRGMGRNGRVQGAAGTGELPSAPESITLADVKVGDSVVATGAMKGGVFTPAKMGVSAPMAGAGRRRGANGDGQAAPAAPAPPQ